MTSKLHKDTYGGWINKNPILSSGDIGWETSTDTFKLGDGVRNWADLPYHTMVEEQTKRFDPEPYTQDIQLIDGGRP